MWSNLHIITDLENLEFPVFMSMSLIFIYNHGNTQELLHSFPGSREAVVTEWYRSENYCPHVDMHVLHVNGYAPA